MSTVKIGTEFRSAYADSNALWRVVSIDGKYAECVIVNERWEHDGQWYDGDYAGVRKPFFVTDVRRAVEFAENLKARMDAADAWFDSLAPGQIVHYNNGFAEFVRCEVIVLDEPIRTGTGTVYEKGQKVLQPIALCGPGWERRDLVGEIEHEGTRYMTLGYHARKVLTGTGAWRPSDSCVYEAPTYSSSYARQGDPTGLPALDLGVTLTKEQIEYLDTAHLGWVPLGLALGAGRVS